jgi:hypothetical protein
LGQPGVGSLTHPTPTAICNHYEPPPHQHCQHPCHISTNNTPATSAPLTPSLCQGHCHHYHVATITMLTMQQCQLPRHHDATPTTTSTPNAAKGRPLPLPCIIYAATSRGEEEHKQGRKEAEHKQRDDDNVFIVIPASSQLWQWRRRLHHLIPPSLIQPIPAASKTERHAPNDNDEGVELCPPTVSTMEAVYHPHAAPVLFL